MDKIAANEVNNSLVNRNVCNNTLKKLQDLASYNSLVMKSKIIPVPSFENYVLKIAYTKESLHRLCLSETTVE